VVRDSGDIFESDEAADLAALMAAALQPKRQDCRRAAMATRLVGFNSAQLLKLSTAEQEAWLRRFDEWGRLWARQGITAFLNNLEQDSGFSARLAEDPQAERRLTDLRHLEELLQGREAAEHAGPEALYEWFQAQRAAGDDGRSERERRLERDGHAVQVTTVHKAKGLEFDFVFCPYLWTSFKAFASVPPALARDDSGWQLVQPGHADFSRAQLQENLERLREGLRVTYVALTRARRRAYFLAGPLGWASPRPTGPTPLDWLLRLPSKNDDESIESWYQDLAMAKKDPQACTHAEALEILKSGSQGLIEVTAPPPVQAGYWQGEKIAGQALQARDFKVAPPQRWRVGSFSSLAHGREDEGVEREGHDIEPPPLRDADATQPKVILADFARGRQAGLCLHEIYERWNFSDDPAELIARALRRYNLESPAAAQALALALEQSKTALLPGLGSLGQAAADPALSEWQFHLPLMQGLNGGRLAEIFARHARDEQQKAYAASLALLAGRDADRLMTGFIDRIVRIGRQWGVVDWKSNYLGDHALDYQGDNLWYGAASQHYPLQIHLYLAALRRYLRHRAPGHQVVGGWLMFARGVEAGSPRGIVTIHPGDELMQELEELFSAQVPA
jgi:exodeoxyribonuclease V beta subunit